MPAEGLAGDRLLLVSTRGVVQEVEFRLDRCERGCRVTSEVRIDGCIPRRGPALLTPLPDAVARAWMTSQAAKFVRKGAKFRPLSMNEELSRHITPGLLSDPAALLNALLNEQLSQHHV